MGITPTGDERPYDRRVRGRWRGQSRGRKPMAVTDAAIVVRSVAEAVADLGAIAHNSRILSDRALANGAATMAVVKADGFGHGIVPVARPAVEHGVGWLGVTSVVEALTLRADGIDAPI